MAVTRKVINRGRPYDELYETTTTSVTGGAGDINLIPSALVHGRRGNFTVNNAGANTITVYPRVSNDGATWFEMDNGSGTAQTTGVKKVYPFTGNYKYIKLDATATTTSAGVVATIYVASI